MKILQLISGVLLIACLELTTTVNANPIYRWISPSGVVSYGIQPPSNADGVKKIDLLPAPPAPPPSKKAPQKAEKNFREEKEIARERVLAARLQLLSALEGTLATRTPVIIHDDRNSPLLYEPFLPSPGVMHPAAPPMARPSPAPPQNGLPTIPPWETGPLPHQVGP